MTPVISCPETNDKLSAFNEKIIPIIKAIKISDNLGNIKINLELFLKIYFLNNKPNNVGKNTINMLISLFSENQHLWIYLQELK